MGVAGSVSLLQNVTLSTQPISSLDWSPDKRGLCICSSFDQMVRVLIITKLNKVWTDDFGLRTFQNNFYNLEYILGPWDPLKEIGFWLLDKAPRCGLWDWLLGCKFQALWFHDGQIDTAVHKASVPVQRPPFLLKSPVSNAAPKFHTLLLCLGAFYCFWCWGWGSLNLVLNDLVR